MLTHYIYLVVSVVTESLTIDNYRYLQYEVIKIYYEIMS